MRQLFICTSDAVLAAAGNPQDLTNVAAGTIGMWQNDDDDAEWLAAAPAADFSIAYGRPNSQAVVIPIDFASARVTTSTYQAGVKFKAEITIPEPVAGKDYTLQLIKLGTEKHERYSWTVTDNGSHKTTAAVAPTLDAAYVKNLASFCAQNRGFSNVYHDGPSIYPGYPMEVEDTTYKMYSIQFKYPRKYGRTRDEAPIQELAIVVPTDNSKLIGLLDSILAF